MARRAAKSATEKTQVPAIVNDVERAEISVPAPGVRFHVLNKDGQSDDPAALRSRKLTREGDAAIYYEMFRQHPTVRAAIEKIAKVAVGTGYSFNAFPKGEELDKDKAKQLHLFFRKSNGAQLLRSAYKDLLIFGDAYWWVERARNGRPIRAKRLHPAFVEIKHTRGEVTSYRYIAGAGEESAAKNYPATSVIHFKLDDPSSDLYGLSLLESLRGVVAVDLFALKFNGKFFENSAQTGTIFALKATDEGEIARNREYLEQNYIGTDNAHKPLLLEGDIEVKRSVSTAQEMQFIEGRKLLREEMLEVLDVPAQKLGITEDSNRSESKEADNTFRQETVQPIQGVVEEEVNNRLVLEMFGWDDIVFAHNEVSTRDSLDMMKLLAEAERMGVLSIDEIRDRQFGLPPVEGGSQHFVQTAAGLIPLPLLDDVARRLISPADAAANPNSPAFDPAAPSIGDLRGPEGEG